MNAVLSLGRTPDPPVSVPLRRRRIDPRLAQIATLATLLVLGVTWFGLGASPAQAIVILAAALATQAVINRVEGRQPGWRSPAITSLSLTLLLRAHAPALWAAAGIAAIGSKTIRWRGKHLFNPACCAIVTLLGMGAWVSPGQWGVLGWGVAALACAASLVLGLARRADTALAFLGAWATLLAARCLALGDPWAIPLHQMRSGALLIFACFMITDPRSIPDARAGRVLFACAVAALGHWLQFVGQIREGLFYALMTISPLTPLIDRLLPAARFQWKPCAP